jgi:hypothetical protein
MIRIVHITKVIFFSLLTLLAAYQIAALSRLFSKKSNHDAQIRVNEHPAYHLYLKSLEQRKKRIHDEKNANGMLAFLHQLRANPITGELNLNDVFIVRERINQIVAKRSRSGMNLQWEEMGPDNVGGRCRAILIDKDNPLNMLAASVSGGLFRSTNGGLSWQPHPFNKQPYYTGISAIKQASDGTIYLATGEGFGYSWAGVGIPTFSAPSSIGNGLFKSTDGGQTFTQIPSTALAPNNQNDEWAVLSEIAIDPDNPNRIFVGTRKGLRISEDGGNTWVEPIGLLAADFDKPCFDVAIGSNGIVHACINNKYYRSYNGLNFQNQMGVNNFPSAGSTGRIEFAISPQDPNYVYASVATPGGGTNGIYKSVDAGESWTLMLAGDASTFNPFGEQGSWNNVIAVDPVNKDRIFVGGQFEVWSYSPQHGWNLIAFWQSDAPFNPYYVHADNHVIVFRPNQPNVMYIGNDGGIFQSADAQNRFPKFLMRNKGFNVTQFYGIGVSLKGELIGGSQDNGTQYINLKGNTPMSATEVKGGDGGQCEISRINPQAVFASSYNGNIERSSNGGGSFGCFLDDRIDGQTNCNMGSVNFFVTRFALWEKQEDFSFTYPDEVITNGNITIITKKKRIHKVDKSVLLLSAGNDLWVCPDALNFSAQARFFPIPVGGVPYAIEAFEDGTVYVGTTSSTVARIEGLSDKYRLEDIIVNESFDTIVNGSLIEIIHTIDSVYKTVPDYPINSSTTNWNWTGDEYKGLKRKIIANSADFGGLRWITGIGIDPNNKERIVVTLSQYGFNNYVFIATDAFSNDNPTFTSIQNNLPPLPVYDVEIDYYNPNNIVLGTDVGIWTSSDGGASWDYDVNFTHVPVFHLRQERLYNDGCRVFYAGTYGRGIFRAFSPDFPNTCEKAPGLATGVNNKPVVTDLLHASFYPNPTSTKSVLEITTSKETKLSITMVDLMGRVYPALSRNQKLMKGTSIVDFDFTAIPAGNYLMYIKTNEKTITKNIVVVK